MNVLLLQIHVDRQGELVQKHRTVLLWHRILIFVFVPQDIKVAAKKMHAVTSMNVLHIHVDRAVRVLHRSPIHMFVPVVLDIVVVEIKRHVLILTNVPLLQIHVDHRVELVQKLQMVLL